MQKVRCYLLLLLYVCLPAFWSCSAAADQKPWSAHQAVVDAFYEKSLKERLASFSGYPFEEQYAIYIYGNQVQHPPATYLASPFAAQGKRIVEPLSERLVAATDDLTIRDIVIVFSDMSRQNTFDVLNDERLMKVLRDSIDRMKDSDWRLIVQKEVSSLQGAGSVRHPVGPSG